MWLSRHYSSVWCDMRSLDILFFPNRNISHVYMHILWANVLHNYATVKLQLFREKRAAES